ncbi:class I SAM-dependent methyltransferase [Rhizobium sp. RAF56]|jgi:SAM-dependent methyltransferase|uniref:class I SAM-dependent methyltransferase n=1 Tax=Rhizobium sp. RAF56 TaxID=3233062 RepID=UPI003F9D16C2
MTIDEAAASDESQAMFNRQLATYRKIVGANLMFHREIYGLLNDVLSRDMARPFRFLDIACGDASASSRMLQESPVAHYYGIDLSPDSLQLASAATAILKCPAELRCCDFADAMATWTDPVDVIWIGMSLHHLQADGKARLIRHVYDALDRRGLFLIWEPTLRDGESRDEWLDRFTALRSAWAALTDEEFAAMDAHVRLADFPESPGDWIAMGEQAGFTRAEQLFLMPNRMGAVFQYWR